MQPERWNIEPSDAIRAGRMLLYGRLTAAVTSEVSHQHITIQLTCKKKSDSGRWVDASFKEATHTFIKVPRQEHWSGDRIGTYYPQKGTFWVDKFADPARVFATHQVLLYAAGLPVHRQVESIQESLLCGSCGRELTDPISIERGIGPTCYGQDTGSKHEVKRRGK